MLQWETSLRLIVQAQAGQMGNAGRSVEEHMQERVIHLPWLKAFKLLDVKAAIGTQGIMPINRTTSGTLK